MNENECNEYERGLRAGGEIMRQELIRDGWKKSDPQQSGRTLVCFIFLSVLWFIIGYIAAGG